MKTTTGFAFFIALFLFASIVIAAGVGAETIPPTYSNNQVNNTLAGQPTLFSLLVNDDTALNPAGQYVFSTNNTGTWTNDSGGSGGTITYDNTSNSSSTGVSTIFSLNHVQGSLTNGYVIVGIGTDCSAQRNVSYITYNGTNMTRLIRQGYQGANGNPQVELWGLAVGNKGAGTYNTTIILPSSCSGGVYAGVTSFSGVDQTTSNGTSVGNSGSSGGTQATVNITTTAGDVVVDAIFTAVVPTVGPGQTLLYRLHPSGGNYLSGSRETATGTKTNMSWTGISDVTYLMAASPLKAAAGGNNNFLTTPQTINSTKVLNSIIGTVVGYRWYLTDNSGNANNTEIFTITTNAGPDVTSPAVSLNSPADNYNTTSQTIAFNATSSDNVNVANMTLYGNWTGSWAAIQTNANPGNNTQTIFSINNIPEGKYRWNVYACDNSSNCVFAASNRTFTVDQTPPVIALPFYANMTQKQNTQNLTLNISVSDSGSGLVGSTCEITIDDTNLTVAVSGGWCNTTKMSLIGQIDGIYPVLVYANDTLDNMALNNSYYIEIISLPDTTPPTYSNNHVNNTDVGQTTRFSLLVNDDSDLQPNGQYVFSTNNTGTWTNESAINFTTTAQWANVTKILNDNVGTVLGYRWYLEDNAGNSNATGIFTLTTTSPGGENNTFIIVQSPQNISYTVAIYNTTFPYTENPISENGSWLNGQKDGIDWYNGQTDNGRVHGAQNPGGGYTDPTIILNNTAWGPNQTVIATAYCTPSDSTSDEVEIRLHSNITAHNINGYEMLWSCVDNYHQMVRWNGPLGNFSMVTEGGTGAVTGDVLKATIVGNNITTYKNGVQQLTATDNIFTGGNPGLGFNYGVGSNYANFGFTDLYATDMYIPLKFTTNISSVQSCWYIIDNGSPVMMPSCKNNTLTYGYGYGQHTITYYANNTGGTVFQSSPVIFTFSNGQGPSTPAITTQPQSIVQATEGGTATFNVSATGNPSPSYQWQKNGANISGANSASYTTPSLTLSDNGSIYDVFVYNSEGSITSNSSLLIVNALPVLQIIDPTSGNPVSVSSGQNISVYFNVLNNGNPVTSGVSLPNITIGGIVAQILGAQATNTSNNYQPSIIMNKTTDTNLAQPPSFSSAWDGSNSTQSCYNNITSSNNAYCRLTSRTSNTEVWLRMNFTIPADISTIRSIKITAEGGASSSSSTEDLAFIIANFSSNRWTKFASDTKTEATRTVTYNNGFNSIINNGQLVLLFEGYALDNGESIFLDYVNVQVNTTSDGTKEFVYTPNGWQANVTVPTETSGQKDLTVSSYYNSTLLSDTQTGAVVYV